MWLYCLWYSAFLGSFVDLLLSKQSRKEWKCVLGYRTGEEGHLTERALQGAQRQLGSWESNPHPKITNHGACLFIKRSVNAREPDTQHPLVSARVGWKQVKVFDHWLFTESWCSWVAPSVLKLWPFRRSCGVGFRICGRCTGKRTSVLWNWGRLVSTFFWILYYHTFFFQRFFQITWI